MHKLLWILVGLVSLPYCAAAQGQPTMRDLMADSVRIQGVDCALFPAAALLDTLYLHSASGEPRRFKPSYQQVEAMEKQLQEKGIMAIRRPLSPPDSINLAYIQQHLLNYKRQYFGFYNTQHQRCLYGQFIEGPGISWLYHHLMIFDGGPSIWEVNYNLDTKQFYFFGYHGLG